MARAGTGESEETYESTHRVAEQNGRHRKRLYACASWGRSLYCRLDLDPSRHCPVAVISLLLVVALASAKFSRRGFDPAD